MYLILLSRIHVETVCLRLIPRCIDACVRVCFFVFRATEPGHFKRLAIQRQLVTECLQHYNYMHPVGHLCYPSLPSVPAYQINLLLLLGPTNTHTTVLWILILSELWIDKTY